MRVVIQRVSAASLPAGGQPVSAIGPGMMILVGVARGDTGGDIEWLTGKISRLRIFDDGEGTMNLDVRQADGEIMAVSQFTLNASTRKGNRPSYIAAAPPDEALPLYEQFVAVLSEVAGREVRKGIFGANMQIALTNDGPVTIIMDSRIRE